MRNINLGYKNVTYSKCSVINSTLTTKFSKNKSSSVNYRREKRE